jgi:hypothetical protein
VYVSSGSGLAGALEAGVEVPRGELGGDGADLEDELVPVGADPGDGPPAEEGPDTDAAEPGDAALAEPPREALVEGGEVVPRWQHDAAGSFEVHREVPGPGVERVAPHVGREEAPREAPEAELVVRGGGGRRGEVRAREREDEKEQEGGEEAGHWRRPDWREGEGGKWCGGVWALEGWVD